MWMRLLLVLAMSCCSLGIGARVSAAPEDFPRPAGLESAVAFWTRVYSEVDGNGGLLHDSRDLAIVYEVPRYPAELGSRTRDRRIKARREEIAATLRTLAKGKREGLDAEQQRILGLFPSDVSNATLKAASKRVRFQLGQADKFRAGIARSGRWRSYILGVLEERGMPPELAALPHVESSFNPKARSHVGASGIWQFTRSTGRRYMRVDGTLDERNDPFLATVAAARLLKANHERLQTWPLALTAYNHGAAGMSRAVRKLGTRDMAVIVDRYESRSFGFASRNFYAEFLAALDVQTQADRYFGPIQRDSPENPEIIPLEHYYEPAVIAAAFGTTTSALREANPAVLSSVWTGQKFLPKGYALRIPRDPLRAAPRVVLAEVPASKRHAKQTPDLRYKVRRGDTVGAIARRHGVRSSEIVALNGLRSANRIRVGQVLDLPSRGGTKARTRSATSSVVPEPIPADGLYRVRRGDTLDGIAKRFGVSMGDLRSSNNLKNPNRLGVGQVLAIPGGSLQARASSGDAGGQKGVYTVRTGDTIEAIAKRFGVTQRDIAELNGLKNRHRIRAGQRLYVPAAPSGR